MKSAVFALAAAAIALASPAVATAEPKEWDIGAYDQCLRSFDGNPNASTAELERWRDHLKMCCEKTGGIYKYSGPGGCVAPPAEQAEWTRDPGRLPVGVFEPLRPTTRAVTVIDTPVLTAEG